MMMMMLLLSMLLHEIGMCIHLDIHTKHRYTVHEISIDRCANRSGNIACRSKKIQYGKIALVQQENKTTVLLSIKNIPHTICPKQVNLQQ